MAATTNIEWTDATINFWIGCTKVSPACDHCYAEAMAKRFGWAEWGAGRPRKERLQSAAKEAFQLQRKATREGRRIRVFANSLSDWGDAEVPECWRDFMLAVAALTPDLDWLLLTKRPKVVREYMLERWQGTPSRIVAGFQVPAGSETGRREQVAEACETLLEDFGLADPDKDHLWTDEGNCRAMQWEWPLPNLWLGVTIENRKLGQARAWELANTPAARRFWSVEPLLGDLGDLTGLCLFDTLDGVRRAVDWVIVGGESGPGARPTHPDWVRAIRDQCRVAGVPFFFKQWGAWLPTTDPRLHPMADGAIHQGNPEQLDIGAGVPVWRVGKKRAGRLLDGREWNESPVSEAVND